MAKVLKPKVLGDISSPKIPGRRDNFAILPGRLNLAYEKVLRLPLTNSFKLAACLVAAAFLIFGSALAPTVFMLASGQSGATSTAERQQLEAQLMDLENQINQYEGQVTGYRKQGATLKGEINLLNDKITKLNLQIQAINLTLNDLNQKIGETKSQIAATESSIETKKLSLAQLIRGIYESDQQSLAEVFLQNPRLSDFFADVENTRLLQDNLRVSVEQITDLKNQLEDKQNQFSLAKADAETTRVYRASQKAEISSTKDEKNQFLAATKGQESKYQALLKQTKETAAQIRSRIFQLLGGGELSFEDAYQYAKLAGGATGIQPSLILAVLDRESALGQNVGKCSYKTAMSPSSQALFLQITGELNINPGAVTVSCPNRDGVYGGAMGPAQFVPSTWNLYKDAVSKITGHSPASPWNNADAFAATALYLKDAMTGCKAIYSASTSINRCAAAKYYAGAHWRSYLWTYGEAVVSRAKGFEEDIATITG